VPDRPVTPFRFGGRAVRDAKPDHSEGPYPLVIVSHGYPGSRVLLSNLTENLASKGYVVVAIDHFESTHADKLGFSSTLLNRTYDILFVLDSVAEMSYLGAPRFLAGMIGDEETALIGYSMGGYGALNAAGAGFTEAFVNSPFGVPGGFLAPLQSGTPEYLALLDDRIKAIVAFAPCCATFGFWDAETLRGLTVPSFFIVGEQDRTAPFAGVEFLVQNATASNRYYLKYESAIHEVPVNPAPPISESNYAEWLHYQEPAWDNRKLNNINQHFVTAFLGLHLKHQPEIYEPFLNLLEPISNNSPRTGRDDPRYWKGFTEFSAIGMELRHLPAEP
jgi:predicted dienelactone hydrolase